MHRWIWFIPLIMVLPGRSWGRPGYLRALLPEAQRCQVCHFTRSGMGGPNAFGKDWKAHGSVQAILDMDSDEDGFTNGEELRAGTLPGDPQDYPGKTRSFPLFLIGGSAILLLGGAGFWFKQRKQG